MPNFEKGDLVVKIIVGGGTKTATTGWKVKKVSKGVVSVCDSDGNESSLKYDADTGLEIDPGIPGFYSEIIYDEASS